MTVSRRGLLVGLGASLICAPAIVRASSLMPVKALPQGQWVWVKDYIVSFLPDPGDPLIIKWSENENFADWCPTDKGILVNNAGL